MRFFKVHIHTYCSSYKRKDFIECSVLDKIGLREIFFFSKRPQKRMDYAIRPTLQHLSLVKIAVELWIQNDFLKFANESQDKLEAEVLINVQSLPLPNQLKKELEFFIMPIGSHIFEWFKYLYNNYLLFRARPKAICWTPHGTIDKAKSIKVFLKERSLSLEKRFELACDHCLVDEIESLWKEMTEEEKLQQEKWCALISHFPVQQNWINYLRGNSEDLSWRIARKRHLSPYSDGCFRAIANNNPTATQYFFKKLSSEEKELILPDFRFLLCFTCKEVDIENVCFILSRMSENQQTITFKNMSETVLSCLLCWPYQRFFLETVNRIWKVLNACIFEELLIRIVDKIATYGNEYRYIFLEFWRSSPDKLKRSVIRPDHFPWQELYDCFVKGEEVCKIISNDANGKMKRLVLLIGNMRVNIIYASINKIKLFKILYGVNAHPHKILWERDTAEWNQFLDNLSPYLP